eukprot:87148_1
MQFQFQLNICFRIFPCIFMCFYIYCVIKKKYNIHVEQMHEDMEKKQVMVNIHLAIILNRSDATQNPTTTTHNAPPITTTHNAPPITTTHNAPPITTTHNNKKIK